MARVTCAGETLYADGSFPVVGRVLGSHTLTDTNWDDVKLEAIEASLKALEIFPSIGSPRATHSASQLSELSFALPSASMFIVASDPPCALQNWH
jgi:peroxiredoxin